MATPCAYPSIAVVPLLVACGGAVTQPASPACASASSSAAASASATTTPSAVATVALQAPADSIDVLAAYAGTWKIQTEHFDTAFSKAKKETTTLRNDCWRSAGYYACNQYVDGDSKALIVFTYDAQAGAYTSYPIPTNGKPAGSGKLVIVGNTWTFPWEDEDNGKPVYFRVVNVFTSPTTIEFRQEFSRDKVEWTATARGVEQKQS